MKDEWEYAVLLLVLLLGFTSPQQDVNTTVGSVFVVPFEDLETRCDNNTEKLTFGITGCACDPDCRKYGDCCPDSTFFKPEEQKLGASPFLCTSMSSVYMMGRCPSDWVNPVVRHHCEHPDATLRDPMRDGPITSLATNISYVNSYCAACHRDLHPDTMEIWALSIACGINPAIRNLSNELYLKYLTYDSNASGWYLNLTSDNIKTHYACQLTPLEPLKAQIRGRLCEKYVVNSCPENWTDDSVKDLCKAYTSHLCYGLNTFRNRHCVVCNNASRESYCLRHQLILRTEIEIQVYSSPSFSVLLDWRNMKQVQHCGERELYDPLSAFCRPVMDIEKSEENRTEALDSCDKVSFSQEEYELAEDNSSVYVAVHNKTYYKHEFLIQEEFLIICLPEDTESRFAPELGYFTVIGLSLSILFLVLHLSVFFMVPKLRNFSATNLSCLCISLLLLYCSFIVSESMMARTSGCIVLALLIHYSLLASFFWMLTISFDIFRVMKQATSKLIISKGRQRPRFCLYCMGSWLLPAVIVGTGLAMDSRWPESSFVPGYGQSACWLNHPDALLIFCVAPLAVVVVFNVCFFCWTAYLIHVNSADAASASSTRQEFPLFLRLGFIMGITWIIGVVAATVEVPGSLSRKKMAPTKIPDSQHEFCSCWKFCTCLWHLFVIFNTLQGLFIFIAFTCTKKVWKEIQNVMHRHKKELTTPATTETSTNTRSSELVMQHHQT